MPAHAGMHVHVECSAPNRGMAGLDGKIDATLYLSWVLEGDDPRDRSKHHHIEVPLKGRDIAPGGQGDDATSLATAVTNALRAHANAPSAVRIGVAKDSGSTFSGKATVRTDAFIEFDGVESMDCACCDALGKVEIDMYGNVTPQVGLRSIRTQSTKRKDDVVDVIPITVSLESKVDCKRGLKEPTDPPPSDPHGPPRKPKGPLTNPDVPPTTPISPAPPPVTMPSDPARPPQPVSPTQPWNPYPVAEPFKAGPYVVQPSVADPVPGARGQDTGPGMRIIRPNQVGPSAYGVFHLALGSWPDAPDVHWKFIPWRVLKTSAADQLREMHECLVSGGITSVLLADRLLILGGAFSSRPVVAFRITINYAGMGFPWKCTLDLWQPCEAHATAYARFPSSSPSCIERREWMVFSDTGGQSRLSGPTPMHTGAREVLRLNAPVAAPSLAPIIEQIPESGNSPIQRPIPPASAPPGTSITQTVSRFPVRPSNLPFGPAGGGIGTPSRSDPL